MKCNKCGYENNDKNKYCENCGNKLKKNIFLISLIKSLIPTLIILFFLIFNINFLDVRNLSILFFIYIFVYFIIDYFILYENFKYNIASSLISMLPFLILSTIEIYIILSDGTDSFELVLVFWIILGPIVSACIFYVNIMLDLILHKIKYVKK